MDPRKSFSASSFSFLLVLFLIIISLCEGNSSSEEHAVKPHKGPVVERDQRKTLYETEYGEISATDVKDGDKSSPSYHLQFFTLEPNTVFLPVLLHAAMVFYVHTGSGKLTWANEDGTGTFDIREGDVSSLTEGSVFYIHSNLEAQRKKLRIYAMFTNTDDSTFDPSIGAYSRINKLLKGFDKKIIQAAFKVPEDLVEAITNKTETPAIVHAVTEKKHNTELELEASFLKYFIGIKSNSKSKKLKAYNIFDNDPDFKNSNGWTLTVTKKQLKQLKRHNIGFLMVNMTMGSMLGPHWNPLATEVAVVLQGEGMVRVVCGSNKNDGCENKRFRVKQGDVFVVPRYHPMAHMSFNKEPLVFMGFSTAAQKNHPQFLAGKGSVLQILDKQIVATSLGVSQTTIDKLLGSPNESIIFECSSCAEEEEKLMEEEKEKEKEEEEKREREEEEEEEAKKREEEEKERERKREEEVEEEVRRREEERKREEEEARRQEREEAKIEEEEARRQQEERERKKEEEAKRERESEMEEEAEKEMEKEAREEKARREREREEKEAKREKEKEEAEIEEDEAKRQQEERERKKEEEAKRERESEMEEEAEREMEKEAREEKAKREREKEEKETRREKEREEAEIEEEEAKREQKIEEEEAKREQKKREEEAKREQKKRERRREEKEAKREEERRRKEKEEREQEEWGKEEAEAEGEEEAAKRQQEERERKREEGDERTEEERETEQEDDEEAKSERGAGWRRQKGGDWGRSREEATTEEEEERETEQEDEEEAESERGGGRRRQKGGDRGRSREEATPEWEEEVARKQQAKRERRREQDTGNSFEARRVLKIRKSV